MLWGDVDTLLNAWHATNVSLALNDQRHDITIASVTGGQPANFSFKNPVFES